jgi:enoyl-CoA hydratase
VKTVLLDRPADGVARVTLNRPEVLNAINRDLLADLDAVLQQAEADPEVRAVVLTGAGRAFSAGFDLKAEAEEDPLSPDEWADRFVEDWQVFLRIWRSSRPFVAAVRGYNLGGALELSLLCDITLASAGAKFGAPEIRHASGPGAAMLPWLTGMKAAKYVLLTGDFVDAAEAQRMGIVTRVVADADLDGEAVAMAERLGRIPPDAMKLNKAAINRMYERLGMLTAVEDNYMVSSLVNGTRAYREMEGERREVPLADFLRSRDSQFEQS